MTRPGKRQRRARKIAAENGAGPVCMVVADCQPSSSNAGNSTSTHPVSKVSVKPDGLTSSSKRTFDDGVALSKIPKGKEFKKFCGHIATGDYELASRTLFKVSESRSLKTISKDSAGNSPLLETRLGSARATKTPGVRTSLMLNW